MLLRLVLVTCVACWLRGPALAAPPPPIIAKAITSIFLADDKGNPRILNDAPFANRIGFFVIVTSENGPGEYGYLVTAKHALKDENGDYFKRVFIRMNDKKQGAEFIALDLVPSGAQKNIYVHDDPTVDIAVIPTLPSDDTFDFLALPTAMIKSKAEYKKSTVTAGSDLFFVNLFAPNYGNKANTPIFRFGRIAMIADDRLRWQEGSKAAEMVELYLVETMSFGGNSGSPVFFSQGLDRQPGSISSGVEEITLAGVMRGNFNEPHIGSVVQTPNAVVPSIAQNVGIAAVTPAYLLRDILYSDELKKFRTDHQVTPEQPVPK